VLVIAGTYVPSQVGGGHIRSIQGIVDQLSDNLEFAVLCADRDPGSDTPYEDVRARTWTQVGDARVWYEPRGRFRARLYWQLMDELRPTALYLNTLYSWRETILPVLIVLLRRQDCRIIAAARGIFDPGALSLKYRKKSIYIKILRFSRLPRRMTLQASNSREAVQIRKALGPVSVIATGHLAPATVRPVNEPDATSAKCPGRLDIVTLGRIHPTKNHEFLIQRLAKVTGSIRLTVAGPAEDLRYWSECRRLAQGLSHVSLIALGPVPHEDVLTLLAGHHVMVLPTLGENFCHAISESLSVGTPVLVSDRTPWRGLAELGCGWDLPLETPWAWETRLQQLCDMSADVYRGLRLSTASASSDMINLDQTKALHVSLFTGDHQSCLDTI
jgi:glycosyltransferase involved in cell wall biosynthesis